MPSASIRSHLRWDFAGQVGPVRAVCAVFAARMMLFSTALIATAPSWPEGSRRFQHWLASWQRSRFALVLRRFGGLRGLHRRAPGDAVVPGRELGSSGPPVGSIAPVLVAAGDGGRDLRQV